MNRRFTHGVALLLSIAGCASPAPARKPARPAAPLVGPVTADTLLLQEPLQLEPPKTISASQAKRDLDVLLFAFRNAYAGYRFVPRQEIQRFEARLAQLRAVRSAWYSSRLCEEIGNALSMVSDGALEAWNGQAVCGQQKRRILGPGRKGVGENMAKGADAGKPWSVRSLFTHQLKVPILAITRFPFHFDSQWDGYSRSIEGLLKSPALIVDLRGSSGPDDQRGYELASLLMGRKIERLRQGTLVRQTPASLALLQNAVRLELWSATRAGRAPASNLEQDLAQYRSRFEAAKAGKLQPDQIMKFAPARQSPSRPLFDRKIYVLVDSRCADSCEWTVEALKQHPHAILVGENTAGRIQFAEPGKLFLPASRIQVQLATRYHYYGNGRSFEKIGYPPDIRVTAGVDALEQVKALIQSGR